MSYEINTLKLLLGEAVMERKQLTKNQKLSMLEFIETANELQTKHLALTGEVKYSFSEKEIKDINDKYILSESDDRNRIPHQARVLRKSLMTQLGAGAYFGAPWAIYRKIRSNYDSCTKKCGTFELNTARRQACYSKCRSEKDKLSKKWRERKEAFKKTGKLDQ